MADRFEMRQALRSMPTGLQPLSHRALGVASGSQVMGQEFRLALDQIGEMLLQQRRDAGVQFLPSGAQQRAVSSVLHQRMLEQVRGVWWDAAAEKKTRSGQVIERRFQIRFRPLRNWLNQFVG